MDSTTRKQFDRFKSELVARCSVSMTDQDRYLTKLCLEINNIVVHKLISAKDVNRLLKNLEQIDFTLIKVDVVQKIENYLKHNRGRCYVLNMAPYMHDSKKYVFSENNFIAICFKLINHLKTYIKDMGYYVHTSMDPKLSTIIFFSLGETCSFEGIDILSGKKISIQYIL